MQVMVVVLKVIVLGGGVVMMMLRALFCGGERTYQSEPIPLAVCRLDLCSPRQRINLIGSNFFQIPRHGPRRLVQELQGPLTGRAFGVLPGQGRPQPARYLRRRKRPLRRTGDNKQQKVTHAGDYI